MSSLGILTPHQVLAVQSSHYAFIVNGCLLPEDAEEDTAVDFQQPVLMLRVAEDVTDHANSTQPGSAATTPILLPITSLPPSPPSWPSPMTAIQLPPAIMASGDGIHGSSGMEHAESAGVSSGMSYSRASTLPMPHTRRASFDLSTHFDTLSLLDGSERTQQPQQHTAGMSEYHRHGLRPPRHNDLYVNEHSIRGSRTDSATSMSGSTELVDLYGHGTRTATPSIRRAATLPGPSPDSDNSDAEDEISPVDFPQPSAVRRRSSVANAATAPTTPPTYESPPGTYNESALSSSVPSTFGNFLGFLSKSTATSPQATERTIPRRQSLSAERRAYYNSMDAAPSLAHRRMSEAAAHQLTLTLKKEDIQREMNRARSMATPPMRPRATPAADVDDEEDAEEQKEKAEDEETKSGVSARAISAIKRKLGVRKASIAATSKLKREGSQSKIHFADMLNEYSQSTAKLLFEPPGDQQYRIVVIGERGDEREERKEENGGESETSRQARHRKNIVSDTTQLSTRVQPIHYLNAPAASAPSRYRVYEDVDTFLLTRPDEKRETQKSRVSTHRNERDDFSGTAAGRDQREELEPLWIAVEDAPASVIQKVGTHFGLHPLTIEDCESGGIREKLEVFTDYLFIVFHALDQVDEAAAVRGAVSC